MNPLPKKPVKCGVYSDKGDRTELVIGLSICGILLIALTYVGNRLYQCERAPPVTKYQECKHINTKYCKENPTLGIFCCGNTFPTEKTIECEISANLKWWLKPFEEKTKEIGKDVFGDILSLDGYMAQEEYAAEISGKIVAVDEDSFPIQTYRGSTGIYPYELLRIQDKESNIKLLISRHPTAHQLGDKVEIQYQQLKKIYFFELARHAMMEGALNIDGVIKD